MKSKIEFKQEVKELCDIAFSNALLKMKEGKFDNTDVKNWDGNDIKIFLERVYEGFKIAQNKIIEQMTFYQQKLNEANEGLKTSKKDRNKQSESNNKNLISKINSRLKILSYIMDGIAWQLFYRQKYITKRFFLDETSKSLINSNISHVKKVADKINEDPMKFALISDLTNFIQIGDLVIKSKDGTAISELKEGKVNDELIKIKEKVFKENSPNKEIENIVKSLDQKRLKQLKRMLKQDLRMFNIADVINNEEGIDHRTGKEIKIISTDSPTIHYYNVILEAIENLKEKNWSYQVEDLSIIHIGIYKPESFKLAKIAISSILNSQTKNYIITDFKQIINNTSEPIFAKPLSPDLINDLLFDNIKIIIGIDISMFSARFEEIFGIKTEFLSRKETMKLIEEDKENAKNIFMIENKAIKFINPKNGNYVILGGGIISKLLFDNVHPISIFEYINKTLE